MKDCFYNHYKDPLLTDNEMSVFYEAPPTNHHILA